MLNELAFEGGQASMAAWLVYGTAKAGLYTKHKPPAANQSADDFELELGARRDQSEFWASHKAKGPGSAELDRQVEIWRAGFLPELVVAIFSKPGWTVPGAAIAALRPEEFARRFSGQYSARVGAVLKLASNKVFPDVPGADFPDPASLPYGPQSCGKASSERAEAWRRWTELEPRLGGDPIAASDTRDFVRQLIARKRDRGSADRGATWVSHRVGYLADLEGFCAVEASDWPRAKEWLTRAAAMSPADDAPRSELSLVYNKLGRNKEALAETDHILETTHEGCAIARAWRRRGYILIDMGDLEAAREAYEQSLVVDPGNQIALDELNTISKAGAPAEPGVATPAPPRVLLTTCHNGRTATVPRR